MGTRNFIDVMVDFGLPFLVLVICFTLLLTGINGEVKAILAGASGWIFKSAYQRRPERRRK